MIQSGSKNLVLGWCLPLAITAKAMASMETVFHSSLNIKINT